LPVSLQLGCPPPLGMPQHVSKQSALSSLLGRCTASCITAPQSGASAFKPSIDAIPLRVLGGSPFESQRWTGGIDPRICQTFAASPAEPGELPFWFSSSVQRSLRAKPHGRRSLHCMSPELADFAARRLPGRQKRRRGAHGRSSLDISHYLSTIEPAARHEANLASSS
jgi:hypothetical protein